MQTSLVGYFFYNKKDGSGKNVRFTVMTTKIPEEKGNGYYTKDFYCREEDFPQITQNKPLKAGKVEVITNAWNSNFLETIYNI